MKYKKIHPHKDETYYVANDDRCLVVSTDKKNGTHISQSMAKWIALNFVENK